MKKLITSIFIVFMMITTIIPVNALEENKSIDYLSNGDYIETTITSNMNTLARSSKSGTKTEKYKNASGEVMWSHFPVTGTFLTMVLHVHALTKLLRTTKPSSMWSLSNKKFQKWYKAIASVTGRTRRNSYKNRNFTCSPSGKLSNKNKKPIQVIKHELVYLYVDKYNFFNYNFIHAVLNIIHHLNPLHFDHFLFKFFSNIPFDFIFFNHFSYKSSTSF